MVVISRSRGRWLLAGAGLLAMLACVGLFHTSQPLAAQPATAPATGVKHVPGDAAFFVHLEVNKIWTSKVGEAFRAGKNVDLEKALEELKSKSGISIDMIETATFFVPHVKEPNDFQSQGYFLTLNKPYDRAKVLAAFKKELGEKDEPKDEKGIVYYDKNPRQKIIIDLSNSQRIAFLLNLDEKLLKPQPEAADAVHANAFKLASSGENLATVGVNMLGLPDEIRRDGIPPEARPFQPLLRSDSMSIALSLAGDRLNMTMRFKGADRVKTAEAEKSLAAGSTMLQTLLGFAIKRFEQDKEQDLAKTYLPLAKVGLDALKAAKIQSDGTEASAQIQLPADMPLVPIFEQIIGRPRSAAARSSSQNNLKQIGLALHNYHDVYNGFPPAALCDKKGKPMLSWRVMILPFIEEDGLYKKFKLDEPWDSEHNKKVLESNPMPRVYLLPGSEDAATKSTHYQVFVGKDALFNKVLPVKITQITDGTSNTIMVVTADKAVPWTKPDDLTFVPDGDPRKLLLNEKGGTNVLFGDGSVRFLTEKISLEAIKAMITKNGGEVVSE